jgi:crotonobetainyl-CoA:carnitine CoA-transferase CaiB-like acyl-CoA transferase
MVNIAASTVRMWTNFCEALGAQALLAHADYKDHAARQANRVQLDADIDKITAEFDTAELMARLNPAGVPCGPIYDIGQAFEDAQVKHLRVTRPAVHPVMGTMELLRSPINLSAFPHPDQFHHAGPDPGEQSDELLRELGYDNATIATMRTEGAVA